MTPQELESLKEWVLQNYFSPVAGELGLAQEMLKRTGKIIDATEFLRKRMADGCHGFCGPNLPRYDTSAGMVRVWEGRHGESTFGRAPDLELDLARLCREKLVLMMQTRMFL